MLAPELLRPGQRQDLATFQAVNNLIKINNEKNHVFFEQLGSVLLHNHLPHHALTLYSLGATKDAIEYHFHHHSDYQREIPETTTNIVESLSDTTTFMKRVGNPEEYGNFLTFYRREVERNGYEQTVNRFLFSGDSISEEVFARLFTGFLHPLLNTLFGVEFDLPDLVCEGLAMGCTQNDPDVIPVLRKIEAAASKVPKTASLADILDSCSSDQGLIDVIPLDAFHLLDMEGLLGTQEEKVMEYTSQFSVHVDDVELRSAELCNATSFMLAGAQRMGKELRMDFFIMHATNCSILVDSLVQKSWVDRLSKARLLTWFGRYCIILHMVIGCPKLDLEPVRCFTPSPGLQSWNDAIECAKKYKDDGHGCKMIRALAHAERVSMPYQDRPEFRMKGSDFEKAAVGVVNSFLPTELVSRAGFDQAEAWIRLAGSDSSWDEVPNIDI